MSTHHATVEPARVRTVPWFDAAQELKRRYERLPPAAQMIGLQLWLPLLFVVLFVLCYVDAFHSLSPHDVRIGVVGEQAATELGGALDKAVPGGFDVTPAPADPVAAVRADDLTAVYDPARTTLIVASANGASTVQLVEKVIAPIAASAGATLRTDDVTPLPPSDSAGTVALYVTLVGTIGGYMIGMFVGMMGGPLSRRVRFAILLGAYVPLSLLATVLIDVVVGALTGHFLALWAILLATMTAVGLVVNGLAYFTGRFVTALALFVFVFLNVPGSGGAIAADLLPQPFRWLSHAVVGHGVVAVIRDTFYGAGPGAHVGVATLLVYGLIGLTLTVPGPAYAAWRHRRRVALGLPPAGMMATAQRMLAEHHAAAAPAGRHEARDERPGSSARRVGDDMVVDDESDEEADVESSTAAAGSAAVG